MSWAKRRGQTTPSPAAAGPPPVQMYNPNQHSNTENQWQHQPGAQSHDNWYEKNPTQANNYWQQPYTNQQQQQPQNPPQAYNQQQQPQQFQYQDQSGYYPNNTPSPYQPPQQQPYGNLQYSQQYNQNNLYGNQQPPQMPQPTEGDGWGNWGWGDEDNSNVQNLPQQQQHQQQHQHQQPQQQQLNTNAISDSFANNETWNWSLDESKQANKVTKTESPLDQLTGKRGKLETPQWSVESQVSQESSDDILQTSESDKSHMLSRSSTISHSPIGQDLQPSHSDDLQLNSLELVPPVHHSENKEIVPQQRQDSGLTPNPTPPPQNTQTPPLALAPPRSDDPSSKGNPYKRAGIGSGSKFARGPNVPGLFPPGGFHNQNVNLESLPDNSEQPDTPVLSQQQPVQRKKSAASPLQQQWAENNEAPINDRNQYLETGQLSDIDSSIFNRGVDPNQDDALPPPGLSRMVPGQFEQPENDARGDGPLPGFSRMVPGQTERNPNPPVSSIPDNLRQPFEPIDPPEGLHRMVPGESSSPESSTRPSQSYQPQVDSEPELNEMGAHQPRSATIGADTPPATLQPPKTSDRSETIGADTSPKQPPQDGAGGNGAPSTKSRKNRRDSIEGQNQVGDLANSVRNLTVDDDVSGEIGKSRNKRDSSDSEREGRGKSPRHERRHHRDRDRDRGRYSPEYRERTHDKRRHRRYEPEADYSSDKDKERRPKDERDYERKYASLRKDKDKERREYRRDKKGDHYYDRYDEGYNNASRPSSQSDSVHDSYRDRDRDRDRDRGHDGGRERRERRHRDKERHGHRRHNPEVFNPYQQGYGYDAYSRYYQQYQYYENLRKTDPQAYAKMYRKYYQNVAGEVPVYGGEERDSVHSGRSSANDELSKNRYTRQSYYSQSSLPHLGGYYRESQTHSISGHYGLDDSASYVRPYDNTDASLTYDDSNLASQRLTPAKFSTAHTKASISSGKFVKILPHYPLDGQTPTVEVCSLEVLLRNDEDYLELKQFPGPLIKGLTHKKTIIEYCENKIKYAAFNADLVDPYSYVLMWELLILLIRQNGMVVGTDIAELLLKNQPLEVARSASVISSIGSNNSPSEIGNSKSDVNSASSALKEEDVTSKFREYLLYGSGKEALEWAMKHGLWGHALFLASKLDKRTYANVLMRFANGLTMNDPLQTLYQLLSGKVPAAVTCVADEKWGDWRPHLAMILSNSAQRPELNRKAITVLGDTLSGRGSLYAAQFCYLMAETGFGRHDGNSDTRLVLLGSDHRKPFAHFADNEAIHMTEIYEYACSLNNDTFTLAEFQRYKYLMATRLADVGLLEKALSYLERIATFIVKNPTSVEPSLVNEVTILSDKLKFYDPVGDADDDTAFGVDLDTSRPDNSWLKDLRSVLDDLNSGALPYQTISAIGSVLEGDRGVQPDPWQQPVQYDAPQSNTWDNRGPELMGQPDYQPEQGVQQEHQPLDGYAGNQYQPDPLSNQGQQPTQQFWPGQQQWGDQQHLGGYNVQEGTDALNQPQQPYGFAHSEPEEVEKESPPEDISPPVPQISMPNQQPKNNPYNDEPLPHEKAPKAKIQENQQQKAQGNGWFGGIFSKFSKPKNQMKLPDDKNPSIVWDADKNRWVNTDGDSGDVGGEFKPPPKMADIMPKMAAPIPKMPQQFNSLNQPQPTYNPNRPIKNPTPDQQQPEINGNPASKPPLPNMFKLQRGRNLKKSYIDVFNPNGKAASSGPSSLPSLGVGGAAVAPQMNFFIPQPVNDPNAPTDFLTPAPPLQYDENNAQMSRWSSASSLSREVQSYTQRKMHPPRR